MPDASANTNAPDRAAADAARVPMLRPQRLMSGPMLALAFIFALCGAAQVGLAVYFLVRGHPAVLLPREQPHEALSVTLGGWLPLGACGLVMIVLAWVVLRARRLLWFGARAKVGER